MTTAYSENASEYALPTSGPAAMQRTPSVQDILQRHESAGPITSGALIQELLESHPGYLASEVTPPAVAALVIALIAGILATGFWRALAAGAASAIGAAAMTALARRQIGGQTGDVAGAAQQWAEIAAWCGLLIGRSAA